MWQTAAHSHTQQADTFPACLDLISTDRSTFPSTTPHLRSTRTEEIQGRGAAFVFRASPIDTRI